MIQLDTHVVVWLFAGSVERLSQSAARLIDLHELLVSPMVELELQYLFEVGRTTLPAGDVLTAMRRRIGLRRVDIPFAEVISETERMSWTRDPFDRLIAATAVATDTRLLTADETIRKNCDLAVW
ncbi:MAG: PIN domain-containing protein [Polyangia bacterium]